MRVTRRVGILLPDAAVSRKRKEPSGFRPPTNTTSAEGAPTPVRCFLFKPLGLLFGISFTVLYSWIAVHCVPVHGLFSQIHLGALSIGPTAQTCSTQLGPCHRGGLRTAYLLVSGLSVSWLTPLMSRQDHSGDRTGWWTRGSTRAKPTAP